MYFAFKTFLECHVWFLSLTFSSVRRQISNGGRLCFLKSSLLSSALGLSSLSCLLSISLLRSLSISRQTDGKTERHRHHIQKCDICYLRGVLVDEESQFSCQTSLKVKRYEKWNAQYDSWEEVYNKNNKRLFPKCLKIVFLTVALARYLFYQNDYRIVMQGK